MLGLYRGLPLNVRLALSYSSFSLSKFLRNLSAAAVSLITIIVNSAQIIKVLPNSCLVFWMYEESKILLASWVRFCSLTLTFHSSFTSSAHEPPQAADGHVLVS